MKIEIVECESWAEFKTRVINERYTDGFFRRGEYLYRGQGNSSWQLSSTFDRWFKGDRAQKVKAADQLLSQFIRECEFEDIPDHVRKDRLLMLSLGQHNGLPTRLLDWSESPYVAAFFAFSGHLRQRGGFNLVKSTDTIAIWALNARQDIWHQEYGCEIVNVPSFGNERIRNQHGRFTYLKAPYNSLEEYVDQFGGNQAALWKYVVPVGNVAAAMADLDAMGINHARIFPGIEGNAKAAEVRTVLDMLA